MPLGVLGTFLGYFGTFLGYSGTFLGHFGACLGYFRHLHRCRARACVRHAAAAQRHCRVANDAHGDGHGRNQQDDAEGQRVAQRVAQRDELGHDGSAAHRACRGRAPQASRDGPRPANGRPSLLGTVPCDTSAFHFVPMRRSGHAWLEPTIVQCEVGWRSQSLWHALAFALACSVACSEAVPWLGLRAQGGARLR